jgi:hypothetical protein
MTIGAESEGLGDFGEWKAVYVCICINIHIPIHVFK